MADVFISYHPDSAGKLVKKIADTLESVGVSCWYAPKRFYAKKALGKITREIRECKVFLLILTRDALKSRYVESETALAFRRVMNYENLTVVPFRADDCDLKENLQFAFYLNNIQIMNGVPSEECVPKLCERIARIVGGKASRRSAERTASRPSENL